MKDKKKLIIAVVLVVLLGILVLAIVNSNKDKTLKVTFDSRGGSEVEAQKLKKGDLIAIPEDPEKEGYEFVGWYYDGEKFDFSKELDKSIELEAKWLKVGTIKMTVSFDSAGGSRVEDQKLDSGEKAKKPSNPVRTGYTFVEWTLNGKTYDFNTKVKEDIKLVAVWKQNEVVVNTTQTKPMAKPVVKPVATKKVYKVTFYSDNIKWASYEVVEGKTIEAPATLPTKDNYIFNGWQYQSNLYDFSKPVTKDMTIEAIWKPILETASLATTADLTNGVVTRTAPNNEFVTVEKVSNQVKVTKTKQLILVPNIKNDGTTASWVALSLNLGSRPDSVEVKSDAVSAAENQTVALEAILDQDLMDETTTNFIVWIDVDAFEGTSKKLVFKDLEGNVIGNVAIEIDYQKLQAPTIKADTNSNVEITVSGNTITVLELPAVLSSGQTSYQLIFDFKTQEVSANGANITPVTDSTAVAATIANTVMEVTFSNALAPTSDDDKITYTIVYQKISLTKVYSNQGDITIDSNLSQYVVHNQDGTFTIAANISGFTFMDNGVKMSAVKDATTGEWSFVQATI